LRNVSGTYEESPVLRWQRVGLKVVLAGATVVSLLSYGGFMVFAFPVLALGFWWAVRNSRRFERGAWIALGALSAALWAWEITYPVTEGTGSAPIVAVVAGVIAASLFAIASQYSVVKKPPAHEGRRRSRDGSPATR
jgi:hypothetical protein